jgi:putative transposase
MGRNLIDCCDGFLLNTKYLLLDRDTKFCPLRGVLEDTDTKVVLLPPRSPNLNAFIERYMRTMKSECLNKLILFGENSLRRALKEFEEHYHTERNHQGIGNKIIEPGDEVDRTCGEIQCNERLGGMLKYYYRDAA